MAPPSYYNHFAWAWPFMPIGHEDAPRTKRNGVFYEGDTVEMRRTTYTGINPDVDYEVRDFYGTVVVTGTSVGNGTNIVWFELEVPEGGWKPGWYRVFLTGPNNDAEYGHAYGVTNFCVLRDDPHFVAMPASDTPGGEGSESPDFVAKGVLGIGTSRIQISDAADPSSGSNTLTKAEADLARTAAYWTEPGAPYADASRPRYSWCQFPNGTIDFVQFQTGGAQPYINVYCADGTVDGSTTYVRVEPGSVSGNKITVRSPDSTTIVETYDNLADANAASTAINGVSNYIWVWPGGSTGATAGPTAIGSAKRDGVVSVVSTLYPLGCHYFEGPANEPGIYGQIVQWSKLFAAHVHAGHANAKAIGPCSVSIGPDLSAWDAFLTDGGVDDLDEIAVHAYGNTGGGEINITRVQFQAWIDLLASHAISKPIWQTESTSTNTAVGYTHLPHAALTAIFQTLILEQLGIPKERNNYWYDVSHGFWSIPNWFENGDGSLEPQAVLYRVLAEETWEKPFASSLDFGVVGNQIFVGNVYTGDAGSTVAILAQSAMLNGSVTLSVAGSSGPLTVVDAFGNASSAVLTSGKLTVNTSAGTPVYVELPVGASVTVYECNGWGGTSLSSHGSTASSALLGGVSSPLLKDGSYMIDWSPGGEGASAVIEPPVNADLMWASPVNMNRVIVWCSQMVGMTDFEVQTTANGTDWVTQKTVTTTGATSFAHRSDADQTDSYWESFWDRQWIFDVPFSMVSAVGLRIKVNKAPYSGYPDLQSATQNGVTTQTVQFQEIGVYETASAEQEVIGMAQI